MPQRQKSTLRKLGKRSDDVNMLHLRWMPTWPEDSHCTPEARTWTNTLGDVVFSAVNDKANLAAVLQRPGLSIPRDPTDEDRPP